MFKIDRAGSRVLCALDVDVSFAHSVAAAGAGIELAHEDLVSYSLFGLLVHACGVEIVRRRWKTYVCARYWSCCYHRGHSQQRNSESDDLPCEKHCEYVYCSFE